jgi:hypothetical protein
MKAFQQAIALSLETNKQPSGKPYKPSYATLKLNDSISLLIKGMFYIICYLLALFYLFISFK